MAAVKIWGKGERGWGGEITCIQTHRQESLAEKVAPSRVAQGEETGVAWRVLTTGGLKVSWVGRCPSSCMPGTCECDLIWKRLFADVIQFKVEPHYLRVGQNPMADVLIRQEKLGHKGKMGMGGWRQRLE